MAKSDKKQKKGKRGKKEKKQKASDQVKADPGAQETGKDGRADGGQKGSAARGKKKKDKSGASKSQASKKGATPNAKLKLADRKCVPCRGGTPPMDAKEIARLLPKLKGWNAPDSHHLEREIKFADFASALDFTIEVGQLAEVEQHHPDIHLSWGKVRIEIWTHKINGLTESDFVLAAKIDQLA